MPLGMRQINNIRNVTLDVYGDVVYYNEKSYPAGYFAAEVLNVSYERQKELGDEGNKLTELFNLFMLSFPEDREEIRVRLLETAKSLRKHLDDIVPFSLIAYAAPKLHPFRRTPTP